MKLSNREITKIHFFVLAISAASLMAACGYYSTSTRTAKDINSIAVPFFENQTAEPDLEITVTEKLINNLIADNTLSVTDESFADAVLNGEIVEFINIPFSFNNELNAEEYNVVIKVKVSLFNRRKNEPIWSDMIVSGDGSYYVDAVDDLAQTFDGAVAESVREITERILNLTVQDW